MVEEVIDKELLNKGEGGAGTREVRGKRGNEGVGGVGGEGTNCCGPIDGDKTV